MSRLVTLSILLLLFAAGPPARSEEQVRVRKVPPPPAFKRTRQYRLPLPKKTLEGESETKASVEGFAYTDGTDLWICNLDGSNRRNLTRFNEDPQYKSLAAQVKPARLILSAFRFAPKKAKFLCLVQDLKWRHYYEVAADGSKHSLVAKRQTVSDSKDYKERIKFNERAIRESLEFRLAHAELAPLAQRFWPYLLSPDLKRRIVLFDVKKWATHILIQDNAAHPRLKPRATGPGHSIRIPCRSGDKESFLGGPARLAAWSPDGKWIALRFKNYPQLCLVAADRSEIRTYFTDSVPKETEWRKRGPDGLEKGKLPVRAFHDGSLHWLRDFGTPLQGLKWSSDSKHLCFYVCRRNKPEGQNDFAIVRIDDGRTVLVENPHTSRGSLPGYDFDFSPDGKSVAMTLLPAKGTWQYRIFVAEVERLFDGSKGPVTYLKMNDKRLKIVGRPFNGTMQWIGSGKQTEEFVGTRLVLPAKSEEKPELTATKARHDTLEKQLASAIGRWQEKPTGALLAKLKSLRLDIQEAEREFFSVVTGASGDFGFGEIDEQMRGWHERVTYLQRETVAAYDALRKYDYGTYVVKYAQYKLEESWYKQSLKDLLHTLKAWNAYNATLLCRYDLTSRKIELEARKQGVRDPAPLLVNLVRRKVAVHVDQAERAVVEAHVLREAALFYQRSYFQGIRAERDKQKGIESPTLFDEAMQYTFVSAKYLVTSMSAIWAGMLDLLAVQYIPTDARKWLGITTLAEKLDIAVREHREETAKRIEALDGLRALGPAEFVSLRDYLREALALPPGREALLPLHEDRHFHEATDGGLFRVAGAFDSTLQDRLSTEYAACAHHARLTARDLERSLNVQKGRLPEGGFTFKALLDPMKFVESIARSGRGEWTQKEAYLKTRRALVKEFINNLDLWRARGFAIESAAPHARTGDLVDTPKDPVWRTHMLLAQKLPGYLDFLVRRKMLIFDAERLALQALRSRAATVHERYQLDHLVELKQMTLLFTLRPLLARTQMLQGIDRIFCRDYPGGLALIERAARNDPKVMDRGGQLKALKKDLSRMRIKETGIDVFHDIGNNCAYTLLLGRVTGGKGFAFGKPITFRYFVWMMASPFDGASTVGGVFNIFLNATKMVAARAVAGTGVKVLDVAGADGERYRQYLDLLAVALVQYGAKRTAEFSYPYLERGFGAVAKKLTRKVQQIEEERHAGRLDAETETARATLRDRLADWIDVVTRLKQLRDLTEQLSRGYRLKSGEVAVLRGKVATIEEFLYLRCNPLSARTIQSALKRYREATLQGFDPEAAHELFVALPIKRLRAFKQNRKFFRKSPGIEQELDSVRCRLAEETRTRIAIRFKQWVEYIAPSGTPPGNAEYRLLDSDNDYTFLLKSNTPEHIRKQIEAAFPEEFGRLLDSNAFADRMPDMNRISSIDEYTRQFRAQVKNPERYVLPGMVRVIPLVLFRKAGILHRLQGNRLVTLSAEQTDQVFRNINLEEWMGADVIMDQCRFIDHYWKDFKAGRIDGLAFLKAQAKYSLRALLGRNISTPEGVRLHNEFIPTGDRTFHRSIVDIAKRLSPSNTREAMLAREWFALKTGKPPSEAFAERMRSGSLSLRKAADNHLAETADALQQFLDRAIPAQKHYLHQRWTVVDRMRKRRPLAELIKDPVYRKAEFEYYSVVCSQAWLLARFSPEDLAWAKGFSKVARQHVSDVDTDVTVLATWYQQRYRERERRQ